MKRTNGHTKPNTMYSCIRIKQPTKNVPLVEGREEIGREERELRGRIEKERARCSGVVCVCSSLQARRERVELERRWAESQGRS